MLLGLKVALFVGGNEVADFIAVLLVGVGLPVADLGALADGEHALVGADLKDAALWDFQRAGLCEAGVGAGLACRVPEVAENAAHAGVEVDGDGLFFLGDDGEGGEEPSGGEFLGDDHSLGGLVEVDPVVEEFEADDFSGKGGAGGGHKLRDDGG